MCSYFVHIEDFVSLFLFCMTISTNKKKKTLKYWKHKMLTLILGLRWIFFFFLECIIVPQHILILTNFLFRSCTHKGTNKWARRYKVNNNVINDNSTKFYAKHKDSFSFSTTIYIHLVPSLYSYSPPMKKCPQNYKKKKKKLYKTSYSSYIALSFRNTSQCRQYQTLTTETMILMMIRRWQFFLATLWI